MLYKVCWHFLEGKTHLKSLLGSRQLRSFSAGSFLWTGHSESHKIDTKKKKSSCSLATNALKNTCLGLTSLGSAAHLKTLNSILKGREKRAKKKKGKEELQKCFCAAFRHGLEGGMEHSGNLSTDLESKGCKMSFFSA